MISDHAAQVAKHYQCFWHARPTVKRWDRGPVFDLSPGFCVLEFPPRPSRRAWTYATCCMSDPQDPNGIELHLFSPQEALSNVELLTVVAHYHRTAARLGLGHTVSFGRPWLPGSTCEYGLLSLPYLDGPNLEHMTFNGGSIRFLWLIPITLSEREFKKARGLNALEESFERSGLKYLDPNRQGVV